LILDYVFVFNISTFLSGIESHGHFALPRRIHTFLGRQLMSFLVVPVSKLGLVPNHENVLTRFRICFLDLKLHLHFSYLWILLN
jgi:hypothetical protein